MGMLIKEESIERFWRKVRKTSKCWIWTAYKDRDGYGSITINGYPRKSHRIAYELANGSFPRGFCVLHRCDTPSCVNPKHLWLGTVAQNNLDRKIKGRNSNRKGENCPTAKLTWSKVRKIRAIRGKRQREIAKKFGISQTAVSHILLGRVWKH